MRALRVSRVAEATILEQSLQRPAGFNLAEFWKAWCAEFEDSRIRYRVTARVSPELARQLPHYFGDETNCCNSLRRMSSRCNNRTVSSGKSLNSASLSLALS